MGLPEVSVCYLIRASETGDDVLLGRKKTGLGAGNLVGPGGKLERGESPVEAAIRETREEVGLTVTADALTLIGELTYPFPHRPAWSQKSWAFVCREWTGVPVESDELLPEWFSLDSLPLDRMWDDAKHWLPTALAGEFVRATFSFAPDGRSVESSRFD